MKTTALSPEDYRNAIYLDFEGEGKKRDGTIPRPHMVGFFKPNLKGKGGKYSSVFFMESWKPVVNRFRHAAQLIKFSDYFEILTDELITNDQHLVCWSIHEPMILEKYLSPAVFERLSPRIHNLHLVAKQYARQKDAFGPATRTYGKKLEDFFAAFYTARVPYNLLSQGAAETCRRIDLACSRSQHWKGFTKRQKSYAKDLVKYNIADCRMTWLIALKVGNYFNG
ncbi:hypothetical protein OAD80_05030 [Porticoccaceae bacterium]|nr:hypothetical protein [Porticoccaceae bacterium]